MIEVRRSVTIVHNYAWGSNRELEYEFSIWDKVRHIAIPLGIVYDKEHSKLYLPRGYDVKKLSAKLRRKIVISNEVNPYDSIGEVKLKYKPKNEVQLRSIQFILGVGDYAYTKPYSQLSLNLITGKGKTYVAIASMAYEGCKFIVITAIRGWLKQWIAKTLEYTDFKKNEVLELDGSKMYKIATGYIDVSKYKIFTCCHASFRSFAKSHGWDMVNQVFKKLGVKYKIFDEAHLYFDSMSKIDYFSNVARTIYITASPYRSDNKENEIYRHYFEFIPSIELYDHESDAKTKYLSIHYNSHPSQVIQTMCHNRYGFDKFKYVSWIVTNETFWKIVYIVFCEAILINPGRTLLLTETNNVMPTLIEWIEFYFPEYKGEIGMFNGESNEKEREIAKQKKIVITNRLCGGTCLDIAESGICFPLLVPAKSKVVAHQLFGRVGREGTVLPMFLYIDLVDEGFRDLKIYYTHKLPVFMKYASSCNKVLYKDIDIDKAFVKHAKARGLYKDLLDTKEEVIKEKQPVVNEDKYSFGKWGVLVPENPDDELPWGVYTVE